MRKAMGNAGAATEPAGMTIGTRHTFADNRSITVAEAICAFALYDDRHAVAIATGYFNAGGFSAIAEALEAAPGVRILLGAEPESFETVDRLVREDGAPSQRIGALEFGSCHWARPPTVCPRNRLGASASA